MRERQSERGRLRKTVSMACTLKMCICIAPMQEFGDMLVSRIQNRFQRCDDRHIFEFRLLLYSVAVSAYVCWHRLRESVNICVCCTCARVPRPFDLSITRSTAVLRKNQSLSCNIQYVSSATIWLWQILRITVHGASGPLFPNYKG